MQALSDMQANKNTMAWLILVAAVALHVADEAIHEFLPFYNNLVISLRDRLGFFPMPTFTFNIWLGGLIGAVIIGGFITPIVNRGGKLIRIIAIIIGIIMSANALGHLLGSLFYGHLIPGFWSSFLLLPAAIFVVWRGFSGDRQKNNRPLPNELPSSLTDIMNVDNYHSVGLIFLKYYKTRLCMV